MDKVTPIMTSLKLENQSGNSAKLSCFIEGDKNSKEIDERGFAYSKNFDESAVFFRNVNGGLGQMSADIMDLDWDEQYFYKAYLVFGTDTFYSNIKNFTTDEASITFGNTSVNSVTASTAVFNGSTYIHYGSPEISERGFVYSTQTQPTINDTKVIEVSDYSMAESISGLSPSTTYYVRAYAINSEGTFYSSETSFTTEDGSVSFGTTSVSSITASSALLSGATYLSTGSPTITERGFVYSTSSSPTTNSEKIEESATNTNYLSESISGLSPSTTYYVRAYAINSEGTFYSAETSFTTDDNSPVFPNTPYVENLTSTSVTLVGYESTHDYDDKEEVTERGFIYSTSSNPTTINGYKVTVSQSGYTSGYISTNLNGLVPSTTYYMRVYATNIYGTYYSSVVSFITEDGIPVFPKDPYLENLGSTSVTLIGYENTHNVDGKPIVRERGFVYSTSNNPTTTNGDKVTVSQSGYTSGYISSAIQNLTPSTTYYARVYAVNDYGTYYSNEVTFETTIDYSVSPLLSYPSNNSDIPCCYLTFQWDQINNATGYIIQVSTSNTFTGSIISWPSTAGSLNNSGVVMQGDATTNSMWTRLGTSGSNGQYYWRVKAIFSNGHESNWSDIWTFTYSY